MLWRFQSYQSRDEVTIAEVIRFKEGKHPPGKIYSLIKSELLRYSSYLSSGIEMNFKGKSFGLELKILSYICQKELRIEKYLPAARKARLLQELFHMN